jgi:hypothetical protein
MSKTSANSGRSATLPPFLAGGIRDLRLYPQAKPGNVSLCAADGESERDFRLLAHRVHGSKSLLGLILMT